METLYLKNSRKIQKELMEAKLLMNLLCVFEKCPFQTHRKVESIWQ